MSRACNRLVALLGVFAVRRLFGECPVSGDPYSPACQARELIDAMRDIADGR